MTPDRPSLRTQPPTPAPSLVEPQSPATKPEEQAVRPREPWVEQWLADEEDDVWNMPCTD